MFYSFFTQQLINTLKFKFYTQIITYLYTMYYKTIVQNKGKVIMINTSEMLMQYAPLLAISTCAVFTPIAYVINKKIKVHENRACFKTTEYKKRFAKHKEMNSINRK